MKRFNIILFLLALVVLTVEAKDLRVAGIFGNNMVLQQKTTTPIWGWADAGAIVKGVREKMPFPNVPDKYSRDVLCFYVADKWFCFVNIEVFDFCCIKCNPEESGELQTTYIGIKPGWHMNKKYWISVYFNQDVPDEKIKELVSKSYDIVVKSLTKKEREMLLSSGE